MVKKEGGNPIELWIETEVRDLKTGKVLEKRKWKSRSWSGNMIRLIYAHLKNTGVEGYDIDGYSRTLGPGTTFRCDAGSGVDTFGIVVGTGTPGTYRLGNKIPHGTGSGQLEYENVDFSDFYGQTFTISRNFVNLSGADITVSECGVYVKNNGNVLPLILDSISPPITVPDQAMLRIVYTIKTV